MISTFFAGFFGAIKGLFGFVLDIAKVLLKIFLGALFLGLLAGYDGIDA